MMAASLFINIIISIISIIVVLLVNDNVHRYNAAKVDTPSKP